MKWTKRWRGYLRNRRRNAGMDKAWMRDMGLQAPPDPQGWWVLHHHRHNSTLL